ncbi:MULTISPECIES: hypothetical protein [Bacillus]|uniref:Uncharacterized protein n=1 Tax=Bacillus thuringiensis T01-328 TaxID=1324966 RepID=A0AAN4HKU3_BACTU|nr:MULTISPECIES: hypothetical protein [Bacillus]MEC0046227.1 hypothetical protein [Bacillus cereus]AFV21590.1 hypothetical protein BTB_502p02850 [Bacillus thuringiensis Bt407]EEM25380.1 hypothetical protein bthur0002_60220 [Bacillus thuringiensis Bt407]ERI01234.1 hypothetical protein BTCBT_002789 [Bacillus thuringiensis T01-328]MEC2682078.1 hypothetical protein [Bacillus thuringiensis]
MISIWVCPITMEKYTFGAEITGTSIMTKKNKLNLLIPLREVVEMEVQEDYYLITVSGE